MEILVAKAFESKNATCFESYMFITTDRYINEHISLDTNKVGIISEDLCILSSGEELSLRKDILTRFNKLLKERHHIDANRHANKLVMQIIYLDDMQELESVIDMLKDFAMKHQTTVAFSAHLNQGDTEHRDQPHVHIIYPKLL